MRPVVALSLLGATILAGCTTTDFTPPTAGPPVQPAVAITVADLPGNWGLASYRKDADRPRTEKEAKAACGNPYQIGSGPNGGVAMHLADQAQPTEVFIKVARNGQVFIGPKGDAGMRSDRLVVSFDNSVLVTDWMDPSARERYGTMVFARCGKKA
ncbi:MAG: hypothetical protein F9K43_24050 [Bauldia sp.]|nr:MAG: hypothetical protein F9K43_24050 [Bauldia sp.]MBZ0228874.1 hypothetical protein [Bauldia sp.]